MGFKRIQKFIFLVFSIFFVVLALTSCGDVNFFSSDDQGSISHDGTNLTIEFTVPKFLRYFAPDISSLQAQATIDEGNPYPLTVDPNTNQINGIITEVSSGTHDLVITYFDSTTFDTDVVLCIYLTQVIVNPGETTYVTIRETDLDRNIDDDYDGYTNLAEVRIGTDPLSDSDVPPGESPYVVCGNGTTKIASSTNFNLTVIVG